MTLGVQKTIQKTSAGDAKAAATPASAPSVLPDDFTVDKDARYTGSVIDFNKWRGFGHITMDEKGVVPGDKVFVHWKNIQTDDRFPRLQQGLQVEFGLMITNDWKGWSRVRCLKAKTVTLPGGGLVNIQDAMDAESMQFVGAQNFRYTGTVKFFDQFRGFGWVSIDDGFAMEDPVPKEIKGYAEYVDLDPALRPRELHIEGFDGDSYRLSRNGARLEVYISCWSDSRRPQWCCNWPGTPVPPRRCWIIADMAAHCCKAGVSADREILYNAYTRNTPLLSPAELSIFEQLLPEEKVNEANFNASRSRWALGWHPPDVLCPSDSIEMNGERAMLDGSAVLWPLAVILRGNMQITRTFVNIGAGTCLPPDPLYQLLASSEGHGFLGLAVEGDATRLKSCELEMASTSATVVPVHLSLNPVNAVHRLLPFLGPMFPEALPPWPLDFLVVDIDGVDCLVAEELMQLVRPKVMQLEIAFHVPPPFRYSMHWDSEKSPHWNDDYDIDRLNPAAGCSLSYALHKFKPFGYHLLRLTPLDAIFVHESVAPIMESGLGIKLPQDEFLCYRSSTLWVQLPGKYVREWFYAPHPAVAFSQIWSNISLVNQEMGRDDVDLVELNTGGKSLRMRIDKLAIEFGIIKGKNGEFMAYNVTLPGGTPITQEAIEHRQEEGAGQRYSGVIQWWHRWQGWGHILPDPGCTFPAAVQQKLDETASQAAAKAKSEEKGKEKLLYFRKDDCEWNLRTEIGKKVTFAVYLDDKGAGAKDVAPVEGQE
ncbi:unnamed protein product [Durusdinium trenchii]|uniref:CSD domain-containing protein n=1 Tax=Durusdinium trenchii TaxID=1381693 RepID=A0ABP0RM58_9DINO